MTGSASFTNLKTKTMDTYNINDNRPDLTPSEIEKGKDFSKVKARATTGGGSFYTPMIAGLTIAVLLISSVLFFGKKTENNSASNTKAMLPTNANKQTVFSIDPTRDTTLVYNTGSEIKIPAHVFVDAKGNEVTGIVELRYREFHNPGEILLSEIPMTYDSAGVQQYFESAGMFEIQAFQNNQPLFIANNEAIEVNLASLDSRETKFNQYYMDEGKDKWNYIGKDTPVAVKLHNKANSEEEKTENFDVIKPLVKNEMQQQFTIDVNYDEFPELAAFNNVLFEVSKKNKSYDPAAATINWDDVKLERIGKTTDYHIQFSATGKTYEVIAYPVIDKNDLKRSQANWDHLYADYKNKSATKIKAAVDKEEKLKKEILVSEAEVAKFEKLEEERAIAKRRGDGASQFVYRTFTVRNFGVWNSDCPYTLPQGALVQANFETEDGKDLEIASVFLIESDKNAVYKINPGEKISFNPSSDNLLIVVTYDNYMGIFTKEQFKSLTAKTKSYNFRVKMIRKENYKPEDINAFI